MTIQIEAGKYYRQRDGETVGPTEPFRPISPMNAYRWCIGGAIYMDDGRFYSDQASHHRDLVEVVPGWAGEVEKEHQEEVADEAAKAIVEHADIKTVIADEAKRIVSGARRSAYGTPEQNFERIARFWQAYFENTDRGAVKITAADVSPLMRLMKEARLAESPAHFDSFVDLIGYTLTGAEVNGVSQPA